MRDSREIVCISCPVGCKLQVSLDDNGTVNVKGNSCPMGKEYGIREYTNPVRIVTTSVWVEDGELPCVSVKTANSVPKDQIFAVLQETKQIKVKAPVHIGDVLLPDVAHTGVNMIATRNVEKRK